MGFMQGLVLKKEYPVGEVVKKALDEGLLVISAGENVLRIVCVLERRGMGFMQGLVLKKEYPVGEVVKKALDEGLLVISAGENVLRIVPPLVIQKEDIWRMEEILEKCFKQIC